MIVIDADVLLIQVRYPRGPNGAATRQAWAALLHSGEDLGITTQAMLEVVGVLSYNVTPAAIPTLPVTLQTQYQLTLFPNPGAVPDYAGCSVAEVLSQMQQQMSLGDAVQAVLIRKFAPPGSILLTWNAKHFRGKVTVPVLTPAEWLQQHPGSTP